MSLMQRSHGSGGNLVAFRSKKEAKGNGGGSKGSIGHRSLMPGQAKKCQFGGDCFNCYITDCKVN